MAKLSRVAPGRLLEGRRQEFGISASSALRHSSPHRYSRTSAQQLSGPEGGAGSGRGVVPGRSAGGARSPESCAGIGGGAHGQPGGGRVPAGVGLAGGERALTALLSAAVGCEKELCRGCRAPCGSALGKGSSRGAVGTEQAPPELLELGRRP